MFDSCNSIMENTFESKGVANENEHSMRASKMLEKQENDQNIKRISNGYHVSKCFHRYITLEKTFCLTLSLKIVLALIYYEHSYVQTCEINTKLIFMINALSILASFLYALVHQAENLFKRSEKKEHEQSGIGSTILGIIVVLIQPISLLEDIEITNWNYSSAFDQRIKVNYILVLGTIFQSIIVILRIMNTLKFKNPRSSRVCKIYGCENSVLYELKCYFKESPIRLIIILLCCSIAFYSICFRIAERKAQNPSKTFEHFQNAIWLVIVTMTSVGFGDYAPQTLVGRIIGVFCVFWGVLNVSIMVLVVVNTFQLDPRQHKSLKILKRLTEKEQIRKVAGQYISYSLARVWRNKNRREYEPETDNERNLKKNLKQLIRSSKNNDVSGLDFSQQMNIHFERVLYGIDNLETNSDTIISYLNNEYFNKIDSLTKRDKFFSKMSSS